MPEITAESHFNKPRMVTPGHQVVASPAVRPPSKYIEYAYFGAIFYAMMGPALGVSVPLLGAGVLALLAAACIFRIGPHATHVYVRLALPVSCALLFVLIQIFVHGERLMGEYTRPFITWMLALIIVQSLTLRKGFLGRFAIAASVIALALVPYLQVVASSSTADFERVGLDRSIGLSNPNDLAAWLGFCALYFLIYGIETPRTAVRVTSWMVGAGFIYGIGLTVSRGTLLAVACAAALALRHVLRRGFAPVVFLLILSWAAYEFLGFDRITQLYEARATQETGRLQVWPLAVERFFDSPVTGVGVSDVETRLLSGRSLSPHNSFLFIALSSGLIPLLFFVGYWYHVARGALGVQARSGVDAAFCIPLVVYSFLISLTSNEPFMASWVVVSACTALNTGVAYYRLRRPLRHSHVRLKNPRINPEESGVSGSA